jgi:hypothetical protein
LYFCINVINMSTAELRSLLIDRIAAINDKTLLFAIKNLIETKSDSPVYITSAEQKKCIEEGIENIKEGKCFLNEQVLAEANKWLKEK